MKRLTNLRTVGLAGLAAVLLPLPILRAQPASSPATPPAKQSPAPSDDKSAGRRVQFAPHIWIDWSIPQVEIDARVVLREGPVELLVCAVGTKEHESVLATPARPLQIREALGLAGMEPGHPRYRRVSTGETVAAIGHPLYIQLTYADGGRAKKIDAHKCLLRTDKKTPVGDLPWIFCGSRRENDRLLADVDGTIAGVVDFDTSLIGLAESHSASDSELWLAANTAAIPPKGTPVKILIRALGEGPLILQLTRKGNFLWNENELSALELDALIRDRISRNPSQQLELSPTKDTSNLFARVAARAITGSGIAPENLSLLLHSEKDDPGLPGEKKVTPPPAATKPAKPQVTPPPAAKPPARDR